MLAEENEVLLKKNEIPVRKNGPKKKDENPQCSRSRFC
jgi:hypothetical protein